MEMKRRSSVALVIGLILLVVVITVYFLFRLNVQKQELRSTENDTGPMLAQFAGNGLDTQYPDSAALNRLVRGYINNLQFETDVFSLTTLVNWPENYPQLTLSFKVTPTTEYLCWGQDFVAADGTTTPYEQTLFLLTDNNKLFAEGQQILTKDEAEVALQSGTPVILALNKNYDSSETNTVFQIAIIGCQ